MCSYQSRCANLASERRDLNEQSTRAKQLLQLEDVRELLESNRWQRVHFLQQQIQIELNV